ncbi:MAG: DUF2059 domain-containing protein [Acidobacteriaceae bacterium]|jgi:hypothetical protein
MNRFTALFAFALSFSLTARADDASLHAKAKEMMVLARVDRINNEVLDTLIQQTTAITTQHFGGTLNAEQKAALADFQKKLTAVIEPQIGWKAMEQAYTDLYASTFTEEQLDAIIAFYKSPAGAALLDKMPTINKQANAMMETKIQALEPQVRQMFEEFEKSQLSAPPPAPAAPAPSPKPAPPTLGPATPK